MNLKRPLATLAVAAAFMSGGWTTASAVSDYPPAGAVMVVTGDLVTGGTAQAMVQNCAVGEALITTLASMPPVEARCEAVISGFAATAPGPGVAEFDVPLPVEAGVVAGEVQLMGSEQTLSFFLDVRAPDLPVIAIENPSSGFPGWPFLLLAGLIVLLAMIAVSRRRLEHATP